MARRLRPGGRLVLDLYNRAFFEPREGRERELAGGVVERSDLVGGRRRVELRYPDGHLDVFEWHLYAPADLVALGAANDLIPITVAGSPDAPAMQVVLDRATRS